MLDIRGAGRYIAAMIVIAALVIGALVGWRRGTAIGGNAKDRAWYAGVFAILFALAGLFITGFVGRVA